MESVEDVVLGEGVSASGAATEEELYGLDEHSWVQWYQKSWLEIEEGKDGRLLVSSEDAECQEEGRDIMYMMTSGGSAPGMAVRKGLIRFLYLVIDFSASMRQTDYKPNRCEFVVSHLTDFIHKYFAENPISYLSIIAMRDGEARFITRMNGQPSFQASKLKQFSHSNPPSGTCSLLKALQLISHKSEDAPLYASREALVVWGSLSSVDPPPFLSSSPDSTMSRVSIVSLCPEVFAVKKTATDFYVSLNGSDFQARINSIISPKESASSGSNCKPVYIKMGFPVKSILSKLSKCACHFQLHNSLFLCPQCGACVCEIPTNCPACKLTLVDKEMLSRVHRLLYDMPSFKKSSIDNCSACNDKVSSSDRKNGHTCSSCESSYCFDCYLFTHQSLKHCTGCLVN